MIQKITNLVKIMPLVFFFTINSYGQTWEIGYPNAADVIATLEDGTLTISGTGEMKYVGFPPWDSFKNSITSVIIGDGVSNIGGLAFFNCSNLTSVKIGNSVASIGESAFLNCSGLTNIYIPNSVISIGYHAFDKTGLLSVAIPNSVTSIGDWAFDWCTGLTSVTIGNSVTSIGNYAFYYCYNLTSVTIPSSVTSIGNWAFGWCTGLTSVTIGNSVTSIGVGAFADCTGVTAIEVDNANPSYLSENGVLFDKEKKTLICYPAGKSGSYIIPNSVTSIGNYAFYCCYYLTSVTIPNR